MSTRSDRNGPPAKLKPRHWKIIELHLAGYDNREIAGELSLNRQTVSRTLQHPDAQAKIKEHRDEAEERLHTLIPRAVEAVADALQDDDPNVRLKAVDRYVALLKRHRPDSPMMQVNFEGNPMQDARAKLVEEMAGVSGEERA